MRKLLFLLLFCVLALGSPKAFAVDTSNEAYWDKFSELGNNFKQNMADAIAEKSKLESDLEYTENNYKQLDKEYEASQQALAEQVRNDQITEDQYKQQMKDLEADYKNKKNGYKDLIKSLEKRIKNAEKEIDKQYEEQVEKPLKEFQKEQKAQEKLANKAEKQQDKLAEAIAECEAMVANTSTRQACIEKAQAKYGLSDEQQQALADREAREAAEAAAAEEAAAQQQTEDQAQENTDSSVDENGNPVVPGADVTTGQSGDEADKLDGGSDTDAGSGGGYLVQCSNSENIFEQIACKALNFLADLRIIAYIIAGFGLVMFAWGAIFNKISWKHFSQIAIGLFLLSMIGPFITYFSGDKSVESQLGYGNFLGSKYAGIMGTGNNTVNPDGTQAEAQSGEVQEEAKKKWSLKDLKGAITAGKNLVKNVSTGVKNASNIVKNVGSAAKNIGSAIKNSGGGIDGLVNMATNIAGTVNKLQYDVKTQTNSLANSIEGAANSYQDMTATEEERQAYQNQRVNGVTGDSGNKSTNKVSEWLNSGAGSDILGKVNDVGNKISDAAASTGEAANATHEGSTIGGNGLGALFGAATAVGEAAEAKTKGEERKAANAAVEAAQKEYDSVMSNPDATADERQAATNKLNQAKNAAMRYQ